MIKKLRAWDLINEKYYSVESWHLEDEYLDLIDSSKNVSDPNAERLWRKESDVILEQSTGVEDIHGKDIFEGDIIHFSYNNYDYYTEVVDKTNEILNELRK